MLRRSARTPPAIISILGRTTSWRLSVERSLIGFCERGPMTKVGLFDFVALVRLAIQDPDIHVANTLYCDRLLD